jgi:hypothetical protein
VTNDLNRRESWDVRARRSIFVLAHRINGGSEAIVTSPNCSGPSGWQYPLYEHLLATDWAGRWAENASKLIVPAPSSRNASPSIFRPAGRARR